MSNLKFCCVLAVYTLHFYFFIAHYNIKFVKKGFFTHILLGFYSLIIQYFILENEVILIKKSSLSLSATPVTPSTSSCDTQDTSEFNNKYSTSDINFESIFLSNNGIARSTFDYLTDGMVIYFCLLPFILLLFFIYFKNQTFIQIHPKYTNTRRYFLMSSLKTLINVRKKTEAVPFTQNSKLWKMRRQQFPASFLYWLISTV